jgi:hypothetical protein
MVMVRGVLLAGAIAWSALGLGGIGLGVWGASWLHAQLPPIVIDAAALGGGITAVGVSMFGLGLAHAVVLAGLRRDQRWARSAAVLLSATLAVALLALAAAAASSAVSFPTTAPPLLAGAAIAAIAAGGYAWCLALLVRRIGSGTLTEGGGEG